MALPNNGNKYELINGELIMRPIGIEHEDIFSGFTLPVSELFVEL